jgi:hypothetical protein
MGMYTEIFFRAEVDWDAYAIIEAIHNDAPPGRWPDHPFFSTPRFDLVTSCSSYYFPGANHYRAEIDETYMGPAYYVSFRANLKNYDDEIDKFFDWVAPHVRDSGAEKTFLGYSQYEENDEPRLYYKEALA